ncbi:LAMI_0G11958g1_1 [Lachancea mirantina]|uniref:LAMI_0G11958g1_1 n=1 Tax=Lachancea mirantina TaxID=1230905 RepID=A0A1G4KB70_9SACH|nr:LAMI_0G11958g1_1 [Lachancea mirantina]
MSEQTENTAEQLREELTSKQLATDGDRDALVARLRATQEQDKDTAPKASPAPVPALNPEERKSRALELLKKKLARANKFGGEQTAVEALERQIARIEKFGLDLDTGLARELGLGKGPQSTRAGGNRVPHGRGKARKRSSKRTSKH